jgi:hypothetical protein
LGTKEPTLEAGAMANLRAAAEGMGRMAVRDAAAADRRMAVRNMLAGIVVCREGWPCMEIGIERNRCCVADAIEGNVDAAVWQETAR